MVALLYVKYPVNKLEVFVKSVDLIVLEVLL